MAGFLAVTNRSSHDAYSRSGEIYQPPNYDHFSQLVSYSPKQDSVPAIAAPMPADTATDPTDPYLNVSTARGALSYPNFGSSNRSPYYSGTPPALYPSSALTSAPHMTASGGYNYGPYPFSSPLPIFDGSTPYSPTYMGLTQPEGSSPTGMNRGRTQRGLNNESSKASKRKVSAASRGNNDVL